MKKNRILLLLLLLVSVFTLAACSKGLPGEQGPVGDKGQIGDKGEPGDKGPDGQNAKAPEFKVDNDGLQWRYEGDTEWKVLVTIPDLIGYSSKYTFTFNTNGGDALDPLANQVFKTSVELPVPTKAGYTFLGWQSVEEGAQEGDVYAENKFPCVLDDVELTAVWGSTVSYAEETAIAPVVLKAGEATTLPAMEAKDGKAFLGWSYDGYTLEAAETEITPDGDRKYTPIYEYTITYELNGGVGEASENVTTAEVGELQVPTWAGHAFQGWYLDAELTVKAEGKPLGDTTVYAKWLETVTVTYVNYGSFAVAPYESLDAFAEEIVELFKNAGGAETTRETFQKDSHPNVKNVFSKAENLEKYQWLIQLALDAVNESGLADDETYGSGQTVATYKEMLTAMLNGDTEAINGSYTDGRSAFRQFIHRLINIGGAAGNTAYNGVTYDFAVEENIAKVNEIMGLPAPLYGSVDELISEFLDDFNEVGGVSLDAAGFVDGSGSAIKTTFGNAEFVAKYSFLAQLALDAANAKAAENEFTDETAMPSGSTLGDYKAMLASIVAGDTTAISARSADSRTCFRQYIHRLINKGSEAAAGRTAYNDYTTDFAVEENWAPVYDALGIAKVIEYSASTTLPTPTKAGYVFAGWFDAEGNEVTEIVLGTTPSAISVTGKWLPTVAVTFDANGGYIGFADITDMREQLCADYNAFAGTSYTIETMEKGDWSPVNFHNWFASEGMAAKYDFLANWMAANGGRTAAEHYNAKAFQLMLAGETLDTNTDIYSISYEFRAFVLGSVIRDGHKTFGSTNYDEATLAEIWAAYEAATYAPVYAEAVTKLPVAAKENYIFAGWFDAEGNEVTEIAAPTTPVELTLTAKWQVCNTVSYDLNGGAMPAPYASREDMVADFLADAYAFYGLNAEEAAYPTVMVDDNWEQVGFANRFSAIYTFISSEQYGAKWAWLKDYIIAKSVDDASGSNEQLLNGSEAFWRYTLGAFLFKDVRASWPKSVDYTVEANYNGYLTSEGYLALIHPTSVVYTEDTAELPVPTKEGYIFAGWFNGDAKVESITIGDESVTYNLVAKWEEPKTEQTITEVAALNASLTDGQTSTDEFTVTGVVVSAETYNSQYKNISFYLTDGTTQIYVYRAKGADAEFIHKNDTLTITGKIKNYYGNLQFVEATIDSRVEGEVEVITGLVEVSIADYASANSWANSTQYKTLNFDEFTTVTANGGANTGKYYTSGTNWRMYQNESPAITITSTKTIASVTIEYASQNTGTLTLNGANVANGATVEVNATTVTFSVGNTGTAANGQARITKITIVYAE